MAGKIVAKGAGIPQTGEIARILLRQLTVGEDPPDVIARSVSATLGFVSIRGGHIR